ncbi:MAG: alpha-L-fucosidase [Thermogutta sp.]|uniref:alpha-L-fucosidase n=1 Tax=Thermogutta sp. TaxID=1962930 RepID=UPI001998BACC|nr:alpha-L-fucosidase [Thermogutta sp.]MBC7350742.1 alpha-L-fucosidase [Thermogutta sp.]
MRRSFLPVAFVSTLILRIAVSGAAFALSESSTIPIEEGPVQPTWESLAQHYRVPDWFRDAKIGVWLHWGIPSAIDENRPNDGSHYGRRMYGPNEGETGLQLEMTRRLSEWHAQRYGPPSEFGYEDFVPLFKAERWDPESLVIFFKECGARFIMPVACHHDNFDLYDSFHPWNSVKMGPHRDIVGEWKAVAVKHGLKFGVSTHLYWSPRFFMTARQYQKPGTLEWKLFNMDFDPRNYASQDSWNQHWYLRCWELIEKYDPDIFNNDAPFPDEKRGKSLGITLFTSFLNRDLKENNGKQTVVISLKATNKPPSAFTYNCERGMFSDIQPYPWIWATDLSGSWFYRKEAVCRMSIPVMIGNVVDVVSKNGIAMLNVALRGDGTLPENQAEYLKALGRFLAINGEGIYGTRPWKVYGEGPTEIKTGRGKENYHPYTSHDIRFTSRPGVLYAFVLAPPSDNIVIKTLASGGILDRDIASVELMGSQEQIIWQRTPEGLVIQRPKTLPAQPVIGFKLLLN